MLDIIKLNKLLNDIETANRGRYIDPLTRVITLKDIKGFTNGLNKSLSDSGRLFSGVFYLNQIKGRRGGIYLNYKGFNGRALNLGFIIDNPNKALGIGKYLNNLTIILGAFKYHITRGNITNKDTLDDYNTLKAAYIYLLNNITLGAAAILSIDDFKAVFSLAGLDALAVDLLGGAAYSGYLTFKDLLDLEKAARAIQDIDDNKKTLALYLLECLRVSI